MRETLNLAKAIRFQCTAAAQRAGEAYVDGERRLRPVLVALTTGEWVVEIQHCGTSYGFLTYGR